MSPVQTASQPRGHDNLHPANPIAAGANRPPDRVLPCLRGGDLALNPREQLFRFREGQSQIGDIAEVIRPADLHDVHAGTLVPGCRQLQNPLHAPPPVQEQEQKYQACTGPPSFTPVPPSRRRPDSQQRSPLCGPRATVTGERQSETHLGRRLPTCHPSPCHPSISNGRHHLNSRAKYVGAAPATVTIHQRKR
jgi:hypothetical protein